MLFDAGADGQVLLHNMRQLKIAPADIGKIVISHTHGDHAGGLTDLLSINKHAVVYVPSGLSADLSGREVIPVKARMQICDGVFSSGILENIEQSLALATERGLFILTGCAHPAMKTILNAFTGMGQIYGLAGGLHGFSDYTLFEGLSLVYPCHCTVHKDEILSRFPDTAFFCGAGVTIDL